MLDKDAGPYLDSIIRFWAQNTASESSKWSPGTATAIDDFGRTDITICPINLSERTETTWPTPTDTLLSSFRATGSTTVSYFHIVVIVLCG